jgi:hypothetical protein
VLLPFAKTPIPDPDFDWHTGEPWYEESPRAFVGLSGESRIADANSPMFRVLAGGGPSTIVSTPETMDGPVYGQALVPLDGVRPVRPTKRSPFRPDVPCETQEVPDLNAPGGAGDQSVEARADRPMSAGERADRDRAYDQLREFVERSRQGKPALDPFTWFGEGRRLQAKRLGIEP